MPEAVQTMPQITSESDDEDRPLAERRPRPSSEDYASGDAASATTAASAGVTVTGAVDSDNVPRFGPMG
jgi:hypothetical protein